MEFPFNLKVTVLVGEIIITADNFETKVLKVGDVANFGHLFRSQFSATIIEIGTKTIVGKCECTGKIYRMNHREFGLMNI